MINYYQTLEVSQTASQTEIKQAYRRLVKEFHPDKNGDNTNFTHEKIILLNAAYEILGDSYRRRCYDQQLLSQDLSYSLHDRQQRNNYAQQKYTSDRRQRRQAELHQSQWLKQVYQPINTLIEQIINPLEQEIEYLSADPFDDQLMEDFQTYIVNCRNALTLAQKTFSTQQNPAILANIAANIYYCMNHLHDGLEELERFTLNYDDYYLHTGKELFRIANRLYSKLQDDLKYI